MTFFPGKAFRRINCKIAIAENTVKENIMILVKVSIKESDSRYLPTAIDNNNITKIPASCINPLTQMASPKGE
ncbi:hypothetical protein HN747_01070 [archaeon]|nr:hypothetical protein [archaeon]